MQEQALCGTGTERPGDTVCEDWQVSRLHMDVTNAQGKHSTREAVCDLLELVI